MKEEDLSVYHHSETARQHLNKILTNQHFCSIILESKVEHEGQKLSWLHIKIICIYGRIFLIILGNNSITLNDKGEFRVFSAHFKMTASIGYFGKHFNF